jgi:hypothetical protein
MVQHVRQPRLMVEPDFLPAWSMPISVVGVSARAGAPRIRSVRLGNLFVAVFRVGDQFLAFRIDNEVEVFQRYLAEKIGDAVIDLNDLECSMSAHEIEAGSLVNQASACAEWYA